MSTRVDLNFSLSCVNILSRLSFSSFSRDLFFLNTLASTRIRGFSEKKRLNAHGFAREFLWSGMLYRPGKSLKTRGKSFSLHSKLNFLLEGCGLSVSDVISGGLLGHFGWP